MATKPISARRCFGSDSMTRMTPVLERIYPSVSFLTGTPSKAHGQRRFSLCDTIAGESQATKLGNEMTRRPDQYASKVLDGHTRLLDHRMPRDFDWCRKESGAELADSTPSIAPRCWSQVAISQHPKSPCSPDAPSRENVCWPVTPRDTRVKPTRSARKVATVSRYSFIRRRFCTRARSTPSVR